MKLAVLCWIYLACIYAFVGAMYNGEYRSVKDYPFVAHLYRITKGGMFRNCGATILSELWVVSAAHCVTFDNDMRSQVQTGSSTVSLKNLIDIEKFFVHGEYDPGFAYDNDIALIKLKTPIEFNEYQQPIQIGEETPKIGENITVLGFGNYHHGLVGDNLRAGQTTIIADEDCLKCLEQKYTNNMICISHENADVIFGDSGGPAIYNNKLIGIISQGCNYTEPNALTKVAKYYEWILQTTGIKY